MIDEPAQASTTAVPTAPTVAIATVDAAGRIVEASPSLAALIGAGEDGAGNLTGRCLADLAAVDERQAIVEALQAARRGEPADEGGCLMAVGRRDDGLPLLIRLRVLALGHSPVEGTGQQVVVVIERVGGPVSWTQHSSTPTVASQRGGPDHVLSHDARAQLRNARNFLGLFSRKLADPAMNADLPSDFIDIAMRALGTGDEIIDRIVWHMRLESDPITMSAIPLTDVVDDARRQSQADLEEHSNLEGQADLGGPIDLEIQVGQTAVIGNRELLIWTFAELFSNARKFSKQPTTVTVTSVRNGDRTTIRIANTGHIIDGSLAPDAFKLGRMLQGRGERPGVGMGLPLCRLIVLRHGGRITIEPDSNGTAVTFELLADGSQLVG